MQTTKKQPINLADLPQSRLCVRKKTDTLRPKSLLAGSINVTDFVKSRLENAGFSFVEFPAVDYGRISVSFDGEFVGVFSSYDQIFHFFIQSAL